MTKPKHRLRRHLTLCTYDGAAFSVMIGSGEYYFAAFGAALSLGEARVGLLMSIPMLIGALLHSINPWLVTKIGSCRRLVYITTTIQTLSFVPLIAGAINGSLSAWIVFAALSLYWGAGLAGGPAWNLWMDRTIPAHLRAPYFARRSLWCQVGVLAGILGAGLILHLASPGEGMSSLVSGAGSTSPVWAFAVVFGLAVVARAVSTGLIWAMHEPEDTAKPETWASRPDTGADTGDDAGRPRRFFVFIAVAATGLYVAHPFLNPYMLTELGMSTSPNRYMLLLLCAFGGRVAAASTVGRIAQRFGAETVLKVGIVALAPCALLWLVSDDLWWLVLVQLLTGAGWAAYELGITLMFFEALPPERRTRLITVFNLVSNGAAAFGSAIGAAVLRGLGEDRQAYVAIFVASAVLRLVAAAITIRLKTRRSGTFRA